MGILYIIATPIGNLKDITLRAVEVLKEVDFVLCEDTRETVKLLNHYQISKPLISYFQHSKVSRVEYIAELLAQGKNLALVTDAGTPGISDPGNKLISLLVDKFKGELKTFSEAESRAELKNLLTISPIPGPNAAITALSVSGFPTDKFVFMGFPPHKKGRQTFFDEVVSAKHTVVFYESSHRILKCLNDLKLALIRGQMCDDSRDGLPRAERVVVCRELTKMFESIYRGSAEEIIKILESDKNNLKGEFVVIIHKVTPLFKEGLGEI